MSTKNRIYEIAILGNVVWNLHSLNNEGTVGNVTEPRSVRIINPKNKEIITTDGISGEMLKHIHFQFLWQMSDKKKLCEGCKKMEPERGFKDEVIRKKKNFQEASREAIEKCLICDLHGFLFPEGEITGSRESLINFGWAVGKGEILRDIHTHARQAVSEKERREKEEISTQMIYHRPTRSGLYAIVSVFQPWRIGLNNVDMSYVIKNNERKERYELALKAYQAMFLRSEGAMTTTRMPHAEMFEGLIVASKTNFPVPVISPLKEDYKEEIKKISEKLGKIFDLWEFSTLDEFIGIMNELIKCEPYEVNLG